MFVITSQAVPVDERETLVYTDLTYRFGAWNAVAAPFVRRHGQRIIDQDIAILARQGENIARYGAEFRDTPADLIHRMVDSLRDAIARGEDPRALPRGRARDRVPRMTLRARLFGLFPALWLAGAALCVLYVAHVPGLASALALLAVLYLVPVAVLSRARGAVAAGRGTVAHRRARLFAVVGRPPVPGDVHARFPALEAALRLVPGLYSAWLRLWGSRVGRGVLLDAAGRDHRPRVARRRRRRRLRAPRRVLRASREARAATVSSLYVRRIRIGDGVLLGAGSRLGPGAHVDAGVALPILTDVGVGRRIRKAG